MAFEFLKPENNYAAQAGELPTFGRGSNVFQYPTLATTGANDYPSDRIHQPWVHYNMRLNNLIVEVNAGVGAKLEVGGSIVSPLYTGGAMVGVDISACSGKKNFDIPHPTKEGWRLRHVCIEGPSADVYVRGKLKDTNVIKLPEYWRELVDLENIDISLTPIGTYQELFVEKIEWGTNILIKNNSGNSINCSYVVYGERIDTSKNIPEYEGTYEDYPGDNLEYSGSAIRRSN